MAASVEGAFRIIDNASGAIDRIDKAARKADKSIDKLGRDLDRLGSPRTEQQMRRTERAFDRGARQADRYKVSVQKMQEGISRSASRGKDDIERVTNVLEYLTTITSSPEIELLGGEEALAMIRLLKSRLNELQREQAKTALGMAGLLGVQAGAGAASGIGRLSKLFAEGSQMAVQLIGKVATLTALFVLLAPAVFPVVGAIVALAASLTSAAVGAGILATALGGVALAGFGPVLGVLIPTIKGLGEVKKAQEAYSEAVKEHGRFSEQAGAAQDKLNAAQKSLGGKGVQSEAKGLFREQERFSKRWRKDTEGARKSLIGAMRDGIAAGNELEPVLARNANRGAAALREGLGNALDKIASPEGSRLLENLGKVFARITPQLGTVFGNLGIAFLRIANAASPQVERMFTSLERWSTRVNRRTAQATPSAGTALGERAQGNAAARRNMTKSPLEDLRDWVRLLRAAGRLLGALVSAGRSPGSSLVRSMTKGLDNLTARIERNPSGLADYFKRASEQTKELWDLIDNLNDLFRGPAAIAGKFWAGVIKAFNAFAGAVEKITGSPFLGTLSAFAAAVGAMKVGKGLLGSALGGLGRKGHSPGNPLWVADVTGGGRGPGKGTPIIGGLSKAGAGRAAMLALRVAGPVSIAAGIAYLAAKTNKDLPTKGGGPARREAAGRPDPTVTPKEAFRRVPGIGDRWKDVPRSMLMRPGEGAARAQAGVRGRVGDVPAHFRARPEEGGRTFRKSADEIKRAQDKVRKSHDEVSKKHRSAGKTAKDSAKTQREEAKRAQVGVGASLGRMSGKFVAETEKMKRTTNSGFGQIVTGMKKYLREIGGGSAPTPGAGTATKNEAGTAAAVGGNAAKGKRIPGVGTHDKVPVGGGLAAPGELILNRHTERDHDRDAQMAGLPTLEERVRGETRPHSALPTHAYGGRIGRSFARGGRWSGGSTTAFARALAARFGLSLGSGYRSPAHNAAVGGSPTSDHMKGTPANPGAWDVPVMWGDPRGHALHKAALAAGIPQVIFNPGDHRDHVHLGFGGGGGPSSALGVGGIGAVAAPAPKLRMPRGYRGGGLRQKASQRALKRVLKKAQGRLDEEYGMGAGVGAIGGGRFKGGGHIDEWLIKALRITGHYSPQNLAMLRGRAMQESGGDPNAQNNWDSNARAGTPSIGLLQTIGPTFATHALPGMNNIRNPVHNAVAAIRYMFSRYGGIVAANGRGYALGGRVGEPDWGGWFGGGGSITANRPTLVGIGDNGRETAHIVPAGRRGAGGVKIGSIKIENHRKGDIKRQIKEEVGQAFSELASEVGDLGMEDEEAIA